MNDKSQLAFTSFESLVESIQRVDRELSAQAKHAVNTSLTMRNWLIGYVIQEYEQRGSDRAVYGERLIDDLATALQNRDVSRAESRELRRYRRFYQVYPQIRESLSPELRKLLLENDMGKTAPIRDSVSPISGTDLLTQLSFTHIRELIALDGLEKRSFYETGCIRGNWSVRELKRQINSLLYERSELSIDKQKLADITNQSSEPASARLTIRDPYVFEFLGLKAAEVMDESHLESQLLDKLQELLLELGDGFCFEARQRRILIGDTHYFVDLVFYHRVLKCHVLVDLKLEAFSHDNIGQLNTYVSWYDANVRLDSDNPPVGILLCTEHDHSLVEYATAGMSNELFVSKYQLELPSKKVLQQQIEAERKRLEGRSS